MLSAVASTRMHGTMAVYVRRGPCSRRWGCTMTSAHTPSCPQRWSLLRPTRIPLMAPSLLAVPLPVPDICLVVIPSLPIGHHHALYQPL